MCVQLVIIVISRIIIIAVLLYRTVFGVKRSVPLVVSGLFRRRFHG